ncbi:hypothetical protein N5O88_05495 [Pseudomonas sp. GD03721]|nr:MULTISPECIES: hypothetical protein [unclassified Pseudomonas]MDH1442059.1 hypothetical protein [Pseudomonas sp. GD03722]WGG02699.1 hypothetical protein N5O88_05495 [Pseudomonas sp. GD03721]WGG06867.1 hypothetical protein N5O87_05505 [Pseudomonas sp. GD03919]
MQVTPMVQRLRAACPLFGRAVSGGIDWEAIEASTKLEALRAHFVLTDETADASFTENVVQQDVAEQFDVCVEFPQLQSDERGQGVGDQVDDVRRELCRALVGYKPTAEHEPIEYLGRQLLLINRAKAVYRFSFVTGYRIGRNSVTDPAETWQELEQDGLPPLEGLNIDVDFIDPMVDRNLSPTGPDGRIEIKTTEELQT